MASSLVTLTEYKAYAGISSTTQDAQITAIIPKVSALVKTLCRRSFVDYVDDAKVDIFSGGFNNLILSEGPILSIDSVEKSTDYGATYSELSEYVDWTLDYETGTIVSLSRCVPGFAKYINGYKVTYKAGYEELPADLKTAVLDLVTYYLKNDGSVHSPKAPGSNSVQIEYITKNTLPAHISRILDQYSDNYS
jgi:uncharacterized phiE125 gp8 family phage protein